MKERIRELMETMNVSQKEFAALLKIGESSLSSILTGRTNPTNKHAQAIHQAFPTVNINWLMFGEGSMYETTQDTTPVQDVPSSIWAQSLFPSSQESKTSDKTSGITSLDVTQQLPPLSHRFNLPQEEASKVNYTPVQPIVKRKIKEIRVFFDDGTYETFSTNDA